MRDVTLGCAAKALGLGFVALDPESKGGAAAAARYDTWLQVCIALPRASAYIAGASQWQVLGA